VSDLQDRFHSVHAYRLELLDDRTIVSEFLEASFPEVLPASLVDAYVEFVKNMVAEEDVLWPVGEPNWRALTDDNVDAIQRSIDDAQYFIDNLAEWFGEFAATISAIAELLFQQIIRTPETRVPACEAMENPLQFADLVFAHMFEPKPERMHLFQIARDTLYQNVCAFSGLSPDTADMRKVVKPSSCRLEPVPMARTYFHDTPFEELLLTEIGG
jgi:hypothetical protein